MALTLESIGMTQEEAQERVVEGLVESLLRGDAGWEQLEDRVADAARDAVDAKVNEVAEREIVPRIGEIIENYTLQETNQWGEKIGKKVTFTEYLVSRAEHWMQEEVDSDGKAKSESRGYYIKQGPRVVHLIDKYLSYHIENAMKEALKNANSAIVGGLEAAVSMKLQEVADSLKVTVKTK